LLWGVQAVQLPLTLLAEDVAWTRHVLAERLPGPTVLAGHCYGGAVISGAATGVEKVIGLVFASAFAPDEGERLGALNAQVPPPAWTTLPSWFLVSTKNRMINPDLLRFMAARIDARTVEVRSSHASPASHPDQVARLTWPQPGSARRFVPVGVMWLCSPCLLGVRAGRTSSRRRCQWEPAPRLTGPGGTVDTGR
jgi:pimeloyl-ACP methyl ester carboxylesterase